MDAMQVNIPQHRCVASGRITQYNFVTSGADPGFLKGGWLIPIGHRTIRSFGLNCPRVHLRAHAPHRRNMSECVLPPL